MSTINIPPNNRKALQTALWMRNGRYPAAFVRRYTIEEINRLLCWRVKTPFEYAVPIAAIPVSTASSRTRWRFAFHSSSHVRHLWVGFECARADIDAIGLGSGPDPYAKLLLELGNGTDVGVAEFHSSHGFNNTTIDTPNNFRTGFVPLKSGGSVVTLAPNTDYYGTISDEGGARIVSAQVYEVSLLADTANGYLDPGVGVTGGPILDGDRGGPVAALRTAWKRNASGIWYWSSDTDASAPTRTSSVRANWLIQSVTAGSASSLGVTPDLTHHSTERRAASGVPVIWKVNAKKNTAVSGDCTVYLIDETDTAVAQISITSTTQQWWSTTVPSPLFFAASSSKKYGIHFRGNGTDAMTIYASSLYQHET